MIGYARICRLHLIRHIEPSCRYCCLLWLPGHLDGNAAVCRRAVAERAAVDPPAIRHPGGGHATRDVGPGTQRREGEPARDRNRRRVVAIPLGKPPAIRDAGRSEAAGIRLGGRQRNQVGQSRDRYWRAAAGDEHTFVCALFRSGVRAKAELIARVVPPAVRSTARRDAACRKGLGLHLPERESARDRYGDGAAVCPTGILALFRSARRSGAECTKSADAPAVRGTRGRDATGTGVPEAHRGEGEPTSHGYRGGHAGPGAVAELASGVLAPTVRGAACGDAAG